MSVETELLILKRLALFRCMPDEQLRLVAFGAERSRLREGRELFRENQPADCAYVVLNGQIDLYRTDTDGSMPVVRTVMPGAMIGELALISKIKRPVSAVAATESEVLRISRSIFRRILDEYPQTASRLYNHISGDFRKMVEKLNRSYSAYGE